MSSISSFVILPNRESRVSSQNATAPLEYDSGGGAPGPRPRAAHVWIAPGRVMAQITHTASAISSTDQTG